MLGVRGDFTGFTYNGIHSSQVGITRVSNSNRYTIGLAPTAKDYVVDVTSGKGKHHFGTDFTKRELSLDLAFDGISERQQQIMRTKWADGEIHELIFDEAPYKIYSAKLANNSVLKHLCFSENGARSYKGEATFKFECFFPYAISRFEYQEDYVAENIVEWATDADGVLAYNAGLAEDSDLSRAIIYYDILDDEGGTVDGAVITENALEAPMASELSESSTVTLDSYSGSLIYGVEEDPNYNNYAQWIAASGIPSNKEYGQFTDGAYKIYNAGDVNIPFQVWFIASRTTEFSIELDTGTYVKVEGLAPIGEDYYFVFNADTHSIEGYNSAKEQTGNLYNYCITGGKFFLLPIGESTLKIDGAQPHDIQFHYWYY